ncbi:MAG: signal peptide peptidase SppA [Bacteroidales bacterium OttesenSCG-928-I14]|jgi:protease-4|nr:signal peptide peptidase SppA [Bacteroidales bacterium OttesenSCG-928-I14]
MKKFIKTIIASIIGVIIACIILFVLSIIIIGHITFDIKNHYYPLQNESILKLNLNGTIVDRENKNFMFSIFNKEINETQDLDTVLAAIKEAKNNKKISGIYIQAGQIKSGYASLESIREALIDFKKTKKFVIAYGDNFNHNSYYISSVADEIYMNPIGMFDFRGLSTSIQYNKNILKKCGVQLQIYKVGIYKSAVEPYTSNKMSSFNRNQTYNLLSDIWTTLLIGISKSRKISIYKLNKYADKCLAFSDPDSIVSYKLIDGLKYDDEIEFLLKHKVGTKHNCKLNFISTKDLAIKSTTTKTPGCDKIAILYAEGEIIPDESSSTFYSKNYINSKEYIKELKKLKLDPTIKAVIFRINSHGGSAYASEQIWHAIKSLKQVKPVVVSMGDYAASGGYYIACIANKIIAEPTTITGSIGIFGLIPNGMQLAKTIGATHDHVSTNLHSNFGGDMLSIPLLGIGLLPARALNTIESAMVQSYIEKGYDLFLKRVAEGRKKTKKQIDVLAQGHIWTGKQALSLNLIDELGDINTAILTALRLANIKNYQIVKYPEKKDILTVFLNKATEKIDEKITKYFIVKEENHEQIKLFNIWKNHDYRQVILPVLKIQ